jgi:hypothetical protein
MVATFAALTRTAMLAMLTVPTMFAMRTGAARPTSVNRAMMRGRPRGPHPLGAHPVDDAVELFDDSIEAAGGIVACRGPLGNRPLLGSPREMNPASHRPKHHHTPGHGQPFPRAIHR